MFGSLVDCLVSMPTHRLSTNRQALHLLHGYSLLYHLRSLCLLLFNTVCLFHSLVLTTSVRSIFVAQIFTLFQNEYTTRARDVVSVCRCLCMYVIVFIVYQWIHFILWFHLNIECFCFERKLKFTFQTNLSIEIHRARHFIVYTVDGKHKRCFGFCHRHTGFNTIGLDNNKRIKIYVKTLNTNNRRFERERTNAHV